MGQIIEVLAEAKLSKQHFVIEWNRQGRIHVQADGFRLEMGIQEFKAWVQTLQTAADRLRQVKS